MQYQIKYTSPLNVRTDCLIVGVYTNKKLSGAAEKINIAYKTIITQCLKNGDITGKIGETLLLQQIQIKDENNHVLPAKRILLVGMGAEKNLNMASLKEIHQHTALTLSKLNITNAVTFLADIDSNTLSADIQITTIVSSAVIASDQAFYEYGKFKSEKQVFKCSKISIAFENKGNAQLDKKRQTGLNQGVAIAKGMHKTKDLGNAPGNICTPSYLASEAKQLQKTYKAIKVSVLEEKDMQKLGMNSLLSVSKGSKQPAKLVIMQYIQGKKGKKPAVLVGKGVTFDTGGISLKPGAQMDEMKYDMCGAASVIGTMHAVADMALPVNLVGIIACVENMPGAQASRPGDIVKSMSGQTIEILNTDAEGRLILCDALTYAEKFDPAAVIDIATLTGACIIALGRIPSAVFSNKQALADKLIASGETIHDRLWQLPIWDDYQAQLDSNFADMANIGGRDAGSITAACFLSRFTKKYPWAHLDIAGTAWCSGKTKGATGRPVPLLTQYLIDNHS